MQISVARMGIVYVGLCIYCVVFVGVFLTVGWRLFSCQEFSEQEGSVIVFQFTQLPSSENMLLKRLKNL